MSIKISSQITKEYKRRVLEESYNRIQKCLSYLNDNEIWSRPNENLVSIGNLILHLEGNIKQYILSGIGNEKDSRERILEFSTLGPISKNKLLDQLKETILKTIVIVDSVKDDQLSNLVEVQCFKESILNIIIHVIEHTSYHTGQITFATKLIKNIDTKYYDGLDLNTTATN